MADEAENTIDEASEIVVTLSDVPEPQVQEESKPEELASSESGDTESAEDSKPSEEAVNAETNGDDKSTEQNLGDNTTADSKIGKPKKGVNKRIGELVKQREDGKRENEGLKREIAELKGDKKPETKSEPEEADFATHSEYLDALDAHELQEESTTSDKKEESTTSNSNETEKESLNDDQKTAMAVISEKVKDTENIPEDFEKVALADDVPITSKMLEAIAECEDPAKVLYHLGMNKDIAGEIAGASTIQQVKAIDNLDRTVNVKPPKPVKLTQVADTIDPVKGSDVQGKTQDEMSFSEYEKSRSQSKVTHGW